MADNLRTFKVLFDKMVDGVPTCAHSYIKAELFLLNGETGQYEFYGGRSSEDLVAALPYNRVICIIEDGV